MLPYNSVIVPFGGKMQKDESAKRLLEGLLLEHLREANRCADLLGYTESVKTLRQAIGMVLHPMGIPPTEYMAFMTQETPQGSLTEDVPQYDKEEPFHSALRQAHSLAEGMSLAGVVTLIEDARNIQYLLQRFDRSAAQAPVRKAMDAGSRAAVLKPANP
jgi:hypothetical protein